jgi:hypothetical protein
VWQVRLAVCVFEHCWRACGRQLAPSAPRKLENLYPPCFPSPPHPQRRHNAEVLEAEDERQSVFTKIDTPPRAVPSPTAMSPSVMWSMWFFRGEAAKPTLEPSLYPPTHVVLPPSFVCSRCTTSTPAGCMLSSCCSSTSGTASRAPPYLGWRGTSCSSTWAYVTQQPKCSCIPCPLVPTVHRVAISRRVHVSLRRCLSSSVGTSCSKGGSSS